MSPDEQLLDQQQHTDNRLTFGSAKSSSQVNKDLQDDSVVIEPINETLEQTFGHESSSSDDISYTRSNETIVKLRMIL